MLITPVIVVNFKTYEEATGKKGLHLAKEIQKAGSEMKKEVAIAVQAEDIRMISEQVKIPVLAQHVDVVTFGAHTGSIIVEAMKEAGAVGTLINHSEHRISEEEIRKTIEQCRKADMITIVCANTNNEAEKLSKLGPDFVAVEPPELIGGKISVSEAKPEIITKTVQSVEGIPVLCGAGVHKKEDVVKALELGSKGILLASGVVKAKEPYKKMKELLEGLT